MITEAERIEKAKRWRRAAVERRDFCQRALENADSMPEPWWNAQQHIIDGMQDRINVIDGLFPEITAP